MSIAAVALVKRAAMKWSSAVIIVTCCFPLFPRQLVAKYVEGQIKDPVQVSLVFVPVT